VRDVLVLGLPLVVVVGAAVAVVLWARERVPDRRGNAHWRIAQAYLVLGGVALVAFIVFAVLATREG
jgi:predicted signal transduction protein with EAL and GGDEF domain